MEKSSEGRPSIFHSLIFTGSPRVFWRLNVSDEGIYLLLHSVAHSVVIYPLKALVNAPKYAINPALTKMSPVKHS